MPIICEHWNATAIAEHNHGGVRSQSHCERPSLAKIWWRSIADEGPLTGSFCPAPSRDEAEMEVHVPSVSGDDQSTLGAARITTDSCKEQFLRINLFEELFVSCEFATEVVKVSVRDWI